MRFITHDYHDDAITNILSHVSNAMAPDSKLIIADCMIPERLDQYTLKAGVMDNLMFVIGGKERTEAGFKEIFARVGLELVKVHSIPRSGAAFVECQKVPS